MRRPATRRGIYQGNVLKMDHHRRLDDDFDVLALRQPAARLLIVAKHLERVADYVTDICELTVYMAEAAVIKHSY